MEMRKRAKNSAKNSHGEAIASVYRPVGDRVGAELSSILNKQSRAAGLQVCFSCHRVRVLDVG
jgi:hypothetical protein